MRWGWLAVLVLAAGAALADDGVWVGEDGQALPETPARKTSEGFGGWLLVTADPEWKAHWDRPPKGRPSLPEARYVSYGERLTILAFYTNPAKAQDGRIDIRCSVRVIRPDGTVATEASDSRCASPEPTGDLQAARISWAVIDYVGEKQDPPGQWVVEMKLTDAVRDVSLELETDFILTSGSVMRGQRSAGVRAGGYANGPPLCAAARPCLAGRYR